MSSFKQNQKRNKTKTFILLTVMFMLLVGVFAAVSQYLGLAGVAHDKDEAQPPVERRERKKKKSGHTRRTHNIIKR